MLAQTAFAGAAVLAVDDHRANLAIAGKRLTRMGYVVSLCDSGVEALDLMQARRFDIALVKASMTGLSGIALLREARTLVATAALPVIVVTTRGDDGAVIEAMHAGADDVVVKPFGFDMLGARIDRLLDRAAAFDRLRQSNAALDARIVRRAMEMGALRAELEASEAERLRLCASVETLTARIGALSDRTSAP